MYLGNDIKFSRNGAVLRIRWSKTLQHSEGILLNPLALIPVFDLCPVTAIHRYFQLVRANVNLPFFLRTLNAPTSAHNIPPFLKLSQKNHHGHWLGCHELLTAQPCSQGLSSYRPLDDDDERPLERGCSPRSATYVYQSGVPDHLVKLHGLIPK